MLKPRTSDHGLYTYPLRLPLIQPHNWAIGSAIINRATQEHWSDTDHPCIKRYARIGPLSTRFCLSQ